MTNYLSDSPLGKKTGFTSAYDPSLLCAIPRGLARKEIGIHGTLPFFGEDIWNCWELSWLDSEGRPEVAVMELRIPAESPFLVESKSLKLYLNSFNMTSFSSMEEVKNTIIQDLSEIIGVAVQARFFTPRNFFSLSPVMPRGLCVDLVDWTPAEDKRLETENKVVSEEIFSHLLRTNCPVTGQPDWATLCIAYKGKKILWGSLLNYLVGLREHAGFHESCVEMIFCKILSECEPERLTVHARFTRRGGIDINPFRSTEQETFQNFRDFRQ